MSTIRVHFRDSGSSGFPRPVDMRPYLETAGMVAIRLELERDGMLCGHKIRHDGTVGSPIVVPREAIRYVEVDP